MTKPVPPMSPAVVVQERTDDISYHTRKAIHRARVLRAEVNIWFEATDENVLEVCGHPVSCLVPSRSSSGGYVCRRCS
jgi:hypothetical protein